MPTEDPGDRDVKQNAELSGVAYEDTTEATRENDHGPGIRSRLVPIRVRTRSRWRPGNGVALPFKAKSPQRLSFKIWFTPEEAGHGEPNEFHESGVALDQEINTGGEAIDRHRIRRSGQGSVPEAP